MSLFTFLNLDLKCGLVATRVHELSSGVVVESMHQFADGVYLYTSTRN